MRVMFGQIRDFAGNEEGATAIEYGLVAALVAIGVLLAMTTLGSSVMALFDSVASRSAEELDNAL